MAHFRNIKAAIAAVKDSSSDIVVQWKEKLQEEHQKLERKARQFEKRIVYAKGPDWRKILLWNSPASPDDWFCCDDLLKQINNRHHPPQSNMTKSGHTLSAMVTSLAARSLARQLGTTFGEPQPGQHYIMLAVGRFHGDGRVNWRYFLNDQDQISRGPGVANLLGRTTWCEAPAEAAKLVEEMQGFDTALFKVRCKHCEGGLFKIRYHVSDLACAQSAVGNGMEDSQRASRTDEEERLIRRGSRRTSRPMRWSVSNGVEETPQSSRIVEEESFTHDSSKKKTVRFSTSIP